MLAYVDEGLGPPIVFLHGIGGDRTRWAPVTDLLIDSYRCIRVDLPGHGGSSDAGCDVASAALEVRGLVEDLGLDSPVIAGHSLGANVALVYGAVFSPRSVVSVDPAPLYLPHLAQTLSPYADRMRGGDFDTAFAEWESRFRVDLVPEDVRAVMAAHTDVRAEVALSYWSGVLTWEDAIERQAMFESALASIVVPTLICLADPPSTEDAAILAQMASSTVEVYEGMGHFLHLVQPLRFADRLRDWTN